MKDNDTNRTIRTVFTAAILLCLVVSQLAGQSPATSKPAPAPARWRGLIGEYGPDDEIVIVLEKDGRLCALFKRSQEFEVLEEINRNTFKFSAPGPHAGQDLTFERDRSGRATQAAVDAVILKRRPIEPESGNQLVVKPVRPVAELMKEALAAQPPQENGDFLNTDLVELRKLDSTIRL